MKIIKILSLICFLTVSAFAQSGAALSGKLLYRGIPVSEASVSLISMDKNNTRIETQTDDNGNYKFEKLLPGTYLFKAESYREKGMNRSQGLVWEEEIYIKKNEIKTFDLDFNEPGQIREQVNINISSGTRQQIDEVSKTVNIIEAQELRDRADFALVETLRTIPGFRVAQLGGFGRTANIKTRGLRNQDTAILIDGIRFRDASSITGDASAFLSDFTLTSVSKIEVLRGSGSSLYGTNAIGGTIDFQTPKPNSGFHGQLGGAFGGLGLNRFRGNLSSGTQDGKFGFNLGASRTIYTRGIDGEDDARNTNFQSRVEYNPFEKTNISARFFVSDADVRLNSSPDTIGVLPASNAVIIEAVPLSRDLLKRYERGEIITNFGNANFIPDADDRDNIQKSDFFSGQIALNQAIGNRLFLNAAYQGLKTKRTNTNGVLGIGFQPFGGTETSVFDGQIHTLNTRFNWTPNTNNLVTFGYEYEWEQFGNDGLAPNAADNFSTRARQTSNTVYAQDLLGFFNDRLQIAGGFRAQFFNLKNPVFSATNPPYSNLTLENPPNAYTFDGSAAYFFNRTGTKIRAHVGNGYRVPSLFERFGTFYSSFSREFIALGDPNLKPERSIAFDGGIDQTLFNDRAKLSATYFYTRLIDTIGFGNVVSNIGATARPFGGYLSTKGGLSRGAEFSGQVRASGSADIFASYTFTNSDQRAPQVSGSGILQTLGVPVHQFTLVATQRFKRAWVSFDFLATSEYLAPIFDSNNFTFQTYVYRFGGNRRADLTGGYTFPIKGEKMSLRLFGTIENLFDYDYFENGFRTIGRTARGGLSFGF